MLQAYDDMINEMMGVPGYGPAVLGLAGSLLILLFALVIRVGLFNVLAGVLRFKKTIDEIGWSKIAC
ncbi:MAG: hypothetical protein JNK57_22610, partial [Planctomycetaceae bacterium]|nr:hypothetical protein [Planctomycetaceae bacterium]